MRIIRSLFFGGFAMLAAVVLMSMPATALDRDPGIYAVSFDVLEFSTIDVVMPSAVIAEQSAVPKASADAHAVAYAAQNQPHTAWRFAVDAYSRIDPHILSA